jgi:hypothetical protein
MYQSLAVFEVCCVHGGVECAVMPQDPDIGQDPPEIVVRPEDQHLA